MNRALALLAALASPFLATPALAQNSGLDPTALIGLPVVTSDGVAVGSTVSVQIDPQGRPTAITARVETPSGETHVQLPIGATRPGERDVRLNADDAEWRAFLARNAATIESAAATPPPPPPPALASAETDETSGNVGAEAAAAAAALADEAAEPIAPGVDPNLPAEATSAEPAAINAATTEPEPAAAPRAAAEGGEDIASAAGAESEPEADHPLSILDADYVVAAPDFVAPNAAADLAQLLASGELRASARGDAMSYDDLLGLEQ